MEYFDSKISAYRAKMLRKAGYEDGFREGERKGETKGIKKGAVQRNAEIARAMLVEGLSAELVSKITGLSSDDIQPLQTN